MEEKLINVIESNEDLLDTLDLNQIKGGVNVDDADAACCTSNRGCNIN